MVRRISGSAWLPPASATIAISPGVSPVRLPAHWRGRRPARRSSAGAAGRGRRVGRRRAGLLLGMLVPAESRSSAIALAGTPPDAAPAALPGHRLAGRRRRRAGENLRRRAGLGLAAGHRDPRLVGGGADVGSRRARIGGPQIVVGRQDQRRPPDHGKLVRRTLAHAERVLDRAPAHPPSCRRPATISPIPNPRHTRRTPLLVCLPHAPACRPRRPEEPAPKAPAAPRPALRRRTWRLVMALYVYWRRGASKPSTTINPAPTQMPASAKLNAGQCQPARWKSRKSTTAP